MSAYSLQTEYASENLNSLPRSSLTYLHYTLSTAVGGTKKENKYKTVNEDGICIKYENSL